MSFSSIYEMENHWYTETHHALDIDNTVKVIDI
jgi:hypothetical protein